MSCQPRVVISAEAPRSELPAWVTKFALVLQALREWGVLKALEGIHVARRDGYSLIDGFAVLLAYFCSNEKKVNGLRGFCAAMSKSRLGDKLAALLGRQSLPSSAALSRLLGSIERDEVEKVISAVGSACGKLPVHPLGMFHDAHGRPLTVFDLDAVVTAFRQRALPTHAELPNARRRTQEAAAPGYPGRKRGETQISSSRLQQAGCSLWVGQATVAGNASMSEAAKESCAWLATWCQKNGIATSQVLIRLDGAGGNEPCAEAVHQAGFKLLARSAQYRVLEAESVQAYLRGTVFHEVPSSLSGPTKHAADLGPLALTSFGARAMRTIVSRFTSGAAGKKSGAGHLIGPAQYEMFITDLEASAWPCEDVVSLYFGRAAVENSFARANEEFGLDRTFSLSRPGQDFAVLVGMLLSNVTAELGGRLLKTGGESLNPLVRGERVARSFEDLPAPLANEVDASAAKQPLPTAPATTTAENDTELLRLAFAKHPQWKVRGSDVLCPNEVSMRLHRQKPRPDGSTWLSFRAPPKVCQPCPKRGQCTRVDTVRFVKEIAVTANGPLPQRLMPLPRPPPANATPLKVALVAAGPWLCAHPLLVVAALRRAFDSACDQVRVAIHVECPRLTLKCATSHLARDAADRQHRRQTFAQHLAWNAADPRRTLKLDFIGGRRLKHLSTTEPLARRCVA
jgi:hypothetical protein